MSTGALPAWIRSRKLNIGSLHEVRSVVSGGGLHSVCDEARCPNRSECFGHGTATFLIMGDVCTRACRYCAVAHGKPAPLDVSEPASLSAAARELALRHVVVTSVDRDDLPDGGAAHFVAVVRELHGLDPRPTVEVLTPDFRGNTAAVDTVLEAAPEVYNHNVETVERLYPSIRPSGRYRWALEVLRRVASRGGPVPKSGLIVGLGEEVAEVERTLEELAQVGCRIVTVGQYLRPTAKQVPVVRYWRPEEFTALEARGRELGIEVVAGPFVRSSYRAEEALGRLRDRTREPETSA
jgi:lipoyl synthase